METTTLKREEELEALTSKVDLITTTLWVKKRIQNNKILQKQGVIAWSKHLILNHQGEITQFHHPEKTQF